MTEYGNDSDGTSAAGTDGGPVPLASQPDSARGGKGFRYFMAAVIGAAAGGLLVFGAWKVFARSGGNSDPLAFAPPNAVSVIHIDLRALARDFMPALRRRQQDLGLDPQRLSQAEKDIADAESITQFMTRDENILLVIRSRSGQTGKSIVREFETAGAPLRSLGNGRWEMGTGALSMRVIVGSAASDVDDKLVLVATGGLLNDENFRRLGEGAAGLRSVVKRADTSKPIWAAAALAGLPNLKPPGGTGDPPETAVGWADLRGAGSGEVEMTFPSEQAAAAACRDSSYQKLPFALKVTQKGKTVLLQLQPGGGNLMDKFVNFIVEMKKSFGPRPCG